MSNGVCMYTMLFVGIPKESSENFINLSEIISHRNSENMPHPFLFNHVRLVHEAGTWYFDFVHNAKSTNVNMHPP